MLYFFTGTDRTKARAALAAALEKEEKRGARVVRVTDAHTIDDMRAALLGGGLFAEKRAVVFDGVLAGDNGDMRDALYAALAPIAKREEAFFILETDIDAATRKQIEKYAGETTRHDLPKKAKEQKTLFALANALRAGNKKELWVGLMREYAQDSAPEAVHGLLFWAAKDMYAKARSDAERARAQALIAALARLPHEARRAGFDLGYALERFVLAKL